MARHEADREDLMAEAAALRPRVELAVPGEPVPVVAGFREAGMSLYFGGDPVYHFDEAGRLRRAFCGGRLYRTQGTTLARLTRLRTAAATELVRHDLSPAELDDFRRAMIRRIVNLAAMLDAGECEILREDPENSEVLAPLAMLLGEIIVADGALAPPLPGKR